MRVVIAGGGNVGTFIAEDLVKAGHSVVIVEVDADRVSGDCLEYRWRDQPRGACGHYDAHFGTGILKTPHDVRALIGSDAACDAQQYTLFFQLAQNGSAWRGKTSTKVTVKRKQSRCFVHQTISFAAGFEAPRNRK